MNIYKVLFGFKNMKIKEFFKWTYTKWSFWVIFVLYLLWSYDLVWNIVGGDSVGFSISELLGSAFACFFIITIFFAFLFFQYNKGFKEGKKSK